MRRFRRGPAALPPDEAEVFGAVGSQNGKDDYNRNQPQFEENLYFGFQGDAAGQAAACGGAKMGAVPVKEKSLIFSINRVFSAVIES